MRRGAWAAWLATATAVAVVALVAAQQVRGLIVTRHMAASLGPQPLLSVTAGTGAPQQYWQVGAVASQADADVSGMQTTMRLAIPKTIADHTTVYLWIGSYLADGAFVQVGVAIPWYDRSPRWFYCAFDPAQRKGPCAMGPSGSGGKAGSWHRFTLSAAPAAAGGFVWTAAMDGQTIGVLPESVGTTGASAPGVFVEQSAFAPHAATDDLGPVEFRPALQVARSSGAWQPAPAALATYSAADTCPPYGIGVAGPNDLWLGSQLDCPPAGSALW